MKITVYGLLSKIYNYNGNIPMPKKISFCGYDYTWDDDFKDYLRNDDKQGFTMSFLENHNDNLQCFLQDTVDIIEDNKEVEKINWKEKESLAGFIRSDNDKLDILARRTEKLKKSLNEIIEVLNDKD